MRSVRCFVVAALLAVAGCGGGEDPESVERDGPTTADEAAASETVVSPTAPSTSVAVEPAPVELVEPTAERAAPPFEAIATDGPRAVTRSLEPWRDGFLAMGEIIHPQLLPDELPEEIASQFPPEVDALYPDGLPDTLDEALAIAEEAGMRDQVEAAVQSIPGAYEAIFSMGPPARSYLFAWSADGDVWEQLDVELPPSIALVDGVATARDRLAIVGRDTETPGDATLSVAATDDLVDWTVSAIEPERPPDLPDDVELDVWEVLLVANELGWMLEAGVVAPFVGEAPLEASSQLEPYLLPGGWGPWPVPNHWFGPWAGEAATTDPGGTGYPTGEHGLLTATPTGFVRVTDTVRYSADGSNWVTQDGFAPPAAWTFETAFAQPAGDGTVVYLDIRRSPVMYRISDDASVWQPLDVPALPAALAPAQLGMSGEYVLDTNDWSGLIEQWVIASPDGERFVAEQFGTAPSGGYAIGVASIQGDLLLVGVADPERETSDWWRHRFTD